MWLRYCEIDFVPPAFGAASAGLPLASSLLICSAKSTLTGQPVSFTRHCEMVRSHPQWLRVRDLVAKGVVGTLRSILGAFSYFNRDPKNVRNVAEWGGGGLMDIGCYPITTSRWIFGEEPLRVVAMLQADPEFGTDRLSSAMMVRSAWW